MKQLLNKNEKTIIFGMSGSGKTVLTKILSRDIKRVIVIDPEYNFEDDTDNLLSFDNVCNLADFLKDNFNSDFRICTIDDEKSESIFAIAEIVQNVTVVIDEVDLICSPTTISPFFKNIIKRGRRKGIHLIVNSRRPAEVHRLLTSQASEVYCFRTKEPSDIKYLQKYTSTDLIDVVKTLPDLSFVHYPSMRHGYICNFNSIVWKD
jgi:Cdc6-like AAA superfamily ATPase